MLRRIQGVTGWSAFALVLASVLPNGANMHVAWVAMALAATVLFVVQNVVDMMDRHRGHHERALWLPAVLFSAVLAWGLVQIAGSVPPAWVHPAWQYLGVDGVIAIDPAFGRHVVLRLATYAMLFWISLRACASSARALAMLKVFAVWGVLVCVYALASRASGFDWLGGIEVQTGAAPFVNRNTFATYAGITLLANLAALHLTLVDRVHAVGSRTGRLRLALELITRDGWLFALGAVVAASALLLTASRGGVFATLLALPVFFAAVRVRRAAAAPVALGVALIAGVAFAGVIAVSSWSSGDTAEAFADAASAGDDGRFLVYPRVVEAIAARPLLGYGPGGFEDGFRSLVPPAVASAEWDLAHNVFLESAIDFGLPAAAALMLAAGLIVWSAAMGVSTRRRQRALPAFAFSVAVLCTLHGVVDFSLQIPAMGALFAFILGLGWSQAVPSLQRRDDDEG